MPNGHTKGKLPGRPAAIQKAMQDTVPYRAPTMARRQRGVGLSLYPYLQEAVSTPFVRDTLLPLLGPDTVHTKFEVYPRRGFLALAEPPASPSEPGFIQLNPDIEIVHRESGGIAFPIERPEGLLPELEPLSDIETPSLSRVLAHEFGHAFQFTKERLPQATLERSLIDGIVPILENTKVQKGSVALERVEEKFAEAFAQGVWLLRLKNAGIPAKRLQEIEKSTLPGAIKIRDWMSTKLAERVKNGQR